VAYPDYPFLEIDAVMKLNIWSKGIAVEGYDPAVYRKDICGCWMKFDEHALETDYGWEIDHILPRSLRGMSYIANLQPLWWRNNRLKGEIYPWVLSATS
jgi:hypothetical protein